MADDTIVARDDAVARLRLIRSANIGPVTYRHLVARFGTAEAALQAIPQLAHNGGAGPPRLASRDQIEEEMTRTERLGARYLFLGDPGYPPLLARIESAPPALIVRGELALAHPLCVAIVGARNASAAACRFARGLAQQLSDAGATIVSGLARGIDTAAHQGSLELGTVGVIASGIDIAFPPENAELQEAIATRGLLIAEQPPGTEPRGRHFPRRNRIIAGLAAGTVVVEAAPKSGSLITARMAAEAGREVMAVPGSPLDPRAQGCNLLIREGATLVQSADDILEQIRPIDARAVGEPGDSWQAEPFGVPSDGDEDRVIALLSPTPVAIDEIVRQSGMPAPIVSTVLLELELAGRLDRHAGGRVSLLG